MVESHIIVITQISLIAVLIVKSLKNNHNYRQKHCKHKTVTLLKHLQMRKLRHAGEKLKFLNYIFYINLKIVVALKTAVSMVC